MLNFGRVSASHRIDQRRAMLEQGMWEDSTSSYRGTAVLITTVGTRVENQPSNSSQASALRVTPCQAR